MGIASDLVIQYGLLGVLISTILAYSILPFPSEAAIVVASFFFNPALVIFIALIGSTIGSITNYYIGKRGITKFINQKSKSYQKAIKLFEKYGALSLIFFIGVPFIGDPLVILAGSFKMKFWKFILFSSIGKIIYLILIISIGQGFESLVI